MSSTHATDGEKIRQFAFDGKDDSYFASSKPPAKGDTFTLTFDQPVTVKSVKSSPGKPKGGNEVVEGVLYGSDDGGKTFGKLAAFKPVLPNRNWGRS